MKSFYIFLNVFLFILAVLLFALNVSFKQYPPDKILSMAPVLNGNAQSAQKIKGGREEIPDIASLWDNNLFSPYRSGEGGPLLGAAKPTGMELLGVCVFGEVSGAIVLDKQAAAAVSLQPSRLRNRGIPSPGGASANAPRFYKLGEQLENGFTLSEINPDSIVLSRGREQIVLKLEFEDEGSSSRITAASEAAVMANVAAKIEPEPQQNVQPENPEALPPLLPGAPGARAASGAPAVPGTIVTPGAEAIVAPGTRPRVQAPLSRRQRTPSAPANPESGN